MIRNAGGILSLVTLAGLGIDGQRYNAARALRYLAVIRENRYAIRKELPIGFLNSILGWRRT